MTDTTTIFRLATRTIGGGSTMDPFDMMQAELHRRLRNDNSIYAKCHEKYKHLLKGPVITF